MEVSYSKAFNKEAREIKTRKTDIRAREVCQIGRDDKRKAEKAQTMGVKQKPVPPVIPPIVESVPIESEGVASPDTTSGQADAVEAPPISDPEPIEEPLLKIPAKDRSFSYLHGSIIPPRPPERRTDPYRPDGWDPAGWAGLPKAIKESLYEEWKQHDPEAV